MTKSDIYTLAKKHQVAIAFLDNPAGYERTITVFGKKKDRQCFIHEAEELKSVWMRLDFQEFRFKLTYALKKWLLERG